MKGLSSGEIIKVLETLIGDTLPYGDSSYDDKVEDNLKNLIDVTNWCLETINDTANETHSPYYSMKRVGERAFDALYEWRDWLNDKIDEEYE